MAILKALLIIKAIGFVSTSSIIVEFSTESNAPSEAATVTSSAAGDSETDCASKCAIQACSCAAFAFLTETKLCLLSAGWGADFGAATGTPAYRRQPLKSQPAIQIGSRHFVVIQQRLVGVLSFARCWTEYETGFGDGTDFWLGLHSIHKMTSSPKLLRVEIVSWSDALFVGEYSDFTVGDLSTNYTMNFGMYITANSNLSADCLDNHKGMQFSTLDRDNDVRNGSCSSMLGNGGWWYKRCSCVNPNGLYRYSAVTDDSAMVWKGATTQIFDPIALKSIRLMLEVA